MGIFSGYRDKLFEKQFIKLLRNLEKSYGSDFYTKLLANVTNYPVYMPDDVNTYIKDGYLYNPTVYSVVSFIAQKAGAIPWGVYEVKNDKALQLYKSASPDLSYFKKQAIKTKALVKIESHELNDMFITPNILQNWAEFFEQVVGFKLVTGNSYVHCIGPKNGNNAGKVKELWTLPAQIISIVAGDKGEPVKQYEMQGDRTLIIPAKEVIHLKYWTPNYSNGQFLYGVSPIQAGRRVVTKSNSSYDAMVSSFQHMGPPGILSPDGTGDVTPFTDEQQEAIEQRFDRKTGAKRAGKPLITSIPIKWQQIGLSPADLTIIESDKMDLRTICNLYHVPSELFNDAGNKTYSNTKEAGSAVYTNAVIPALSQFRDAINQFVKGRYEENIFIDFDVSMISELQDDLAMLSTALSSVWWLTPNEKRDMMSFGTDETNPLMDEYYIPAGFSPLARVMDEPEVQEEVIAEAEKLLNIKDYGK